MTSLTWLIYLSGIVDSFIALKIIGFVLTGICLFVYFVAIMNDDNGQPKYYSSSVSETCKALKNMAKKIGISAFIIGLLLCVVPDQKTFLMIAGVEVGQQVVESEKIQGIIDPALDLVRKKIMDELNKTEDKKGS